MEIKFDNQASVFVAKITLYSQGVTEKFAEEALIDAMESYLKVYKAHKEKMG